MTATLASPWPELDKHLTLNPGDLILVTGPGSSGVSMTALNFAIHAAFEQRVRSEVYSLEISSSGTMERVIANRARINSEHLYRQDRLTDEESERLAALKANHTHVPLTAVNSPFSLDLLRAHAKAKTAEPDPLRLMVVDGLHLVDATRPWSAESTGRVARGLKSIAVDHGAVVIATAHLEFEDSPRKTVFGLDAAVAAAADWVLMLAPETPGSVALSVAKAPAGRTLGGSVLLAWEPEYSRLTSQSPVALVDPVDGKEFGRSMAATLKELDAIVDATVHTPWGGLDPLVQLRYRQKVGVVAQRGTHEATVGRRVAAHAAQDGPVLLFTGYPPSVVPAGLVVDQEPAPTPEHVAAAVTRMTAQGTAPRLIVIERYERMKLTERPADYSRADELEWCGRFLGHVNGDWATCPIMVTTVVDQEPLLDKHLAHWAGPDSPAAVMMDFCQTLVVLNRSDEETVQARVELDDVINPWIVHNIAWSRPPGARPVRQQVAAIPAPVVQPAAPRISKVATLAGVVQALETSYAGHRFRSRLEARWAVFFDALGIQWAYEPERYQLPSGKYLPDFWLPAQKMFFEVKGVAPAERYTALLGELAVGTGSRVVLAVGSIPRPDRFEIGSDGTSDFWMEVFDSSRADGEDEARWDNYQAWTQCPKCGIFDVCFEARSCRACCACQTAGCDCGATPEDVLRAFGAARSARFEHGQSGA